MSPWLIYAWLQVDAVRAVFGTASVLGIFFGCMAGVFAFTDGIAVPGWARAAVVSGAIVGLVTLALPSSRTIALMYVLPRVADSEVIQRDVPELYRMAVDALKSQLSDELTEGGRR